MKKKVYLIYGGDDIPYEPCHVITSFLDKSKAEEFLKTLREEDKRQSLEGDLYAKLSQEYEEFLDNYGYLDKSDEEQVKLISEKFGVTEDYVDKVLNSFYYPQYYYMDEIELEDGEEDYKDSI